MKKTAPYGSWASPISAELVAKNAKRYTQLAIDADAVYWTETRPEEGGRVALMRLDADGRRRELSTPEVNVRTRVHEYGGASFLAENGVIAFSNFDDQILYLVEEDGLLPLTTSGMRYADGVLDAKRGRIICVREDHTQDGGPENTIVALNLGERGPGRVLCSGSDFCTTPRLSPDGKRLCWLAWNHPEMPWTRTQLWTADVDEDGSVANEACLVDADESVFQPAWSPDGMLYFVSDRSGWWNLYRWDDGRAQPVALAEAEFGRPQWSLGIPTYGFRDEYRAVCSYTLDGKWHLAEIDLRSGVVRDYDLPYTDIADVHVQGDCAYFLGGSPDVAGQIVRVDPDTGACTVLDDAGHDGIPADFLSRPQSIQYPTLEGETAHALFYAPKNTDFDAPPDERPPLMVISHGGPTSATSSVRNLGIQYWTSRGFAVLDVNYGGSTGYGRAYRRRLDGEWGIVDVDDCIAGARYLVEQDEVDGKRMVIRGGSAGGFTTLAALTFRDVFRAGASYYGVSDLGALAEATHKFESRYLDGLIAPYSERPDLYRERSPIEHVDQLSCPIIFFQGMEDKVVPPAQAEKMVDALRAKGIPVAYLSYEGEQHGFRRAENIIRSLTAELYFYGMVLGIPLGEEVEPVPIENLPTTGS